MLTNDIGAKQYFKVRDTSKRRDLIVFMQLQTLKLEKYQANDV